MQLQSRINVQSKDFGSATRGMIALQALVVELANNHRVREAFETMRDNKEHRGRIARFQRLVRAGRIYPQAWAESRLQEPNAGLGTMLDTALVDLFDRHVPHVCLPLLQAFLGMEWIRLTGCQSKLSLSLNGTSGRIQPPDFSTMTKREQHTATRQYVRALRSAQLPRSGRVPPSKTVTVRNVKWYVRHRLCGVSIGTLTQEYHRIEHPKQDPYLFEPHRRLIVRSIQKTAALLDLPARRS